MAFECRFICVFSFMHEVDGSGYGNGWCNCDLNARGRRVETYGNVITPAVFYV